MGRRLTPFPLSWQSKTKRASVLFATAGTATYF
jgi:hypothetical protein